MVNCKDSHRQYNRSYTPANDTTPHFPSAEALPEFIETKIKHSCNNSDSRRVTSTFRNIRTFNFIFIG